MNEARAITNKVMPRELRLVSLGARGDGTLRVAAKQNGSLVMSWFVSEGFAEAEGKEW